jgi:hypothetical protein
MFYDQKSLLLEILFWPSQNKNMTLENIQAASFVIDEI